MIDIHTHILPEIDDGSRSVEESVSMLGELYKQGVDTVVATPHFYIDKANLSNFLHRRETAALRLMRAVSKMPERPAIAVGAEVQFYSELAFLDGIEELCLGGTRFLLVEMPFEPWPSHVYQTLEQLYFNREIIPVIAHVERFLDFNRASEVIPRLIESNAQIQVNCSALLSRETRRRVRRLIRDGVVSFAASDCHNMTSRPPNIADGMRFIAKKCGSRATELLKLREDALKKELQVF